MVEEGARKGFRTGSFLDIVLSLPRLTIQRYIPSSDPL